MGKKDRAFEAVAGEQRGAPTDPGAGVQDERGAVCRSWASATQEVWPPYRTNSGPERVSSLEPRKSDALARSARAQVFSAVARRQLLERFAVERLGRHGGDAALGHRHERRGARTALEMGALA